MSVAVAHGDDLAGATSAMAKTDAGAAMSPAEQGKPIDPRLRRALPAGQRRQLVAGRGVRYGTQFHALMDRLTAGAPLEREAARRDLGIAEREFAPMWEQAQRVLRSPALARFFDPSQYRRAANEVSYLIETGEVRRIDRLVEFEDEMWVLDYKTGDAGTAEPALMEQYRAQLAEYCAAVRRLYGRKQVSGAMVFADATLEVLHSGSQLPRDEG